MRGRGGRGGEARRCACRLMRGHKVVPSAETLHSLGLRAVPLYEVLKTPNV